MFVLVDSAEKVVGGIGEGTMALKILLKDLRRRRSKLSSNQMRFVLF